MNTKGKMQTENEKKTRPPPRLTTLDDSKANLTITKRPSLQRRWDMSFSITKLHLILAPPHKETMISGLANS